jgi:hypothetical protein
MSAAMLARFWPQGATSLRRITPPRVKDIAKTFVRQEITCRAVLSSLHYPRDNGKDRVRFYDPIGLKSTNGLGLPIPPPDERMGYALESDQAFLDSGRGTADTARSIMAEIWAHACTWRRPLGLGMRYGAGTTLVRGRGA